MKILVGGTFDTKTGKPSWFVQQLGTLLGADWTVINGGSIQTLKDFDANQANVLIWMPNVANNEIKMIDRLKATNPAMLLIQSKRVVEKDYTESDVIGRLLKSHSGLGIMITKPDGYRFKLLDPLGNQYCDTAELSVLSDTLCQRIDYLRSLSRVRSIQADGILRALPEHEFVDLVKVFGTNFARFVNAVNPNRLLGNSSTRCAKGFPAQRQGDHILVTRRNVNKETLSPSDFVEVWMENDTVNYFGSNKPSVDTPIQLKLFDHYTNVNYMVHGHVYVENGVYTAHKIPCGFVEEFDEIISLFPNKAETNFTVNLKGHGCLMMASDLNWLNTQVARLMGRPFPEE